MTTSDGGATWTEQYRDRDELLSSVHFVDATTGWAVGGGLIVATNDGGATWSEQYRDTRASFSSVHFANATTGWAVGSRNIPGSAGVIVTTNDGGVTWTEQYRDAEASFSSVHFVNATTGWAVGRGRTILKSLPVERAPFISDFQVSEDPISGIVLKWTVQDEHPDQVACEALAFLSGTTWVNITIPDGLATNEIGVCETLWNPKDYSVSEGTDLYYRVTLQDSAGLTFAHEILDKSFTYRPWFASRPTWVQALLIAPSVIGAYVLACWLLVLLFPLALLWLHNRVPVVQLADLIPSKPAATVVKAVVSATGFPYFLKRSRVRRVWVERYRQKRQSLRDLPPSIQTAYLQHPDVLDAWVERRADQAKEGLDRIESVHQRRVYIDLPVRVGRREEGRQLVAPKQAGLRMLLDKPRAVLVIIGEGGAGKSTLAAQLAFWALAKDPGERLAAHRMIPVFLEEETEDLVAAITGQLKQMVGPEEVEADVVASLLRHKRLLVIVDALSERTPATQRHVESIHQSADINVLVVTTRRQPDFGPLPVTKLWPEKVTVERIVYFLMEYLRRTGSADLFPEEQPLQLGQRLLAVVKGRGKQLAVTPLLITLFVDQAIDLRKRGEPLEKLPLSIAETMLEHVRRTNPRDPATPNYVPTEVVVRAARVLGMCSLAEDCVPRDFFRDMAEKVLKAPDIGAGEADVIQRLVDNGVLEERDRGGTRILRFDLDPLAEYMAALYWLDRWRDDAGQWQTWLSVLSSLDGYPEEIRGFLTALEDCVITYREDFNIPAVDFPWEDADPA